MHLRSFFCLSSSFLGLWLTTRMVQAQVVPDRSLNTIVTSINNDFTITNGSAAGSNLFHSFSQFSLPSNGSATFDLINTPDISTIFSRITGGDISSIDGTIRTLNHTNPVNLLLLNPNGIIFGPNARLDIGGAFLATTASRIEFADGVEFNPTNPTPLLSLSVPIGLQLGTNPGAITVQGTGHQLATQNPILAPYEAVDAAPGLLVEPGNTIALVGGDLTLNAAVLTAPTGRIDLASLGVNATIPIGPNFQLGNAIGDRRDIQLTDKSLIDVNAIDAGSIQLQGRAIDLQSGSLLWVQNRGPNPSGDITVNATDQLNVDGSAFDLSSVSGIINESIDGNGGNINLTAPAITVSNGANIMSRAFGPGQGGHLALQTGDLAIVGIVPIAPDIFSTVNSYTAGDGAGGNLTVMAQNVAVLAGGTLGTATVGSGHGGDLRLTADTVTVSGLTANLLSSTISVPTLGGSGDAGNLTLTVRKLSLSDGGFVLASSIGAGNAGNVTINATTSIDVAGLGPDPTMPSQTGIASTVTPPTEPYKSLFGLTATTASGASGDVRITTPDLRVYDGADITVDNYGSGIVGSIYLNADRLTLKTAGNIGASSNSGQGGNLWIRSNLILLNDKAEIAIANYGTGDGGNITIDAPLIIGLNNSDVVASAIDGTGGRINITTQGLFGLKYRDRLTPESDINASSALGLDGTVQVTTIGVDPNAGLTALPIDIIDPNQKIAAGCGNSTMGSFVVTGRGGVPVDPTIEFIVNRTWADLRPLPTRVIATDRPRPVALIEATTWQLNAQNQPELIASQANSNSLPTSSATCAQSTAILR
jgi:filamentous hemagglutinin family protein